MSVAISLSLEVALNKAAEAWMHKDVPCSYTLHPAT